MVSYQLNLNNMINEDKLNSLLWEDFKLSDEDINNYKKEQSKETSTTNANQFYQNVKNTWDTGWFFKWFDKAATSVWNFINQNIIGAPVRAVGGQILTAVSGVKNLVTGKNEWMSFDTPFGKISSLDVGTEKFKEQWTSAALDTLATIEMFAWGPAKKALSTSASTIKNTIVKKLANLWIDVWYWAISGAVQWWAAWYNEDYNTTEWIQTAIAWGIGGGILWWVFSIASGLRNMRIASINKKLQASLNKSFDETVWFYPKTELKWDRSITFKEDMNLRDALYTAKKQQTWVWIETYTDWNKTNKSLLDEAVSNMDKFAQSASDAKVPVKMNKITDYDIKNLTSLNKDLWAADIAKKNDLLLKLKSWTLLPNEWVELNRMLNNLYKKAGSGTKQSIAKLWDDTYDTIINYWKQQWQQDIDLAWISDIVKTTKDSIRALTVTQKAIDNLKPKFILLESAARQWDTSGMSKILDEIYNNGLGIKSKARLITSMLKNITEHWTINRSIDDIIKTAFSEINDDTAKKIYQEITEEYINKVKQANTGISKVSDIEVQPKQKTYIPPKNDFWNEINMKKIGSDKIKTYPIEYTSPVVKNTIDELPVLNKEPINYTKQYSWQTQTQLNSRKVSVQRKIVELSKNKPANIDKITEYENEIEQLNEMISKKKK